MRFPIIADAPGRLDFLGGVADYSGALVLETPTVSRASVRLDSLDQPVISLCSAQEESEATLSLRAVAESAPQWSSAHDIGVFLRDQGLPAWSLYVLGSLLLLAKESDHAVSAGLRITVDSQVPVGMGVSSSAALEVASLRAFRVLLGVSLSDHALALLAQNVENAIVGAPCGLMDQLTCSCGAHGSILPILCQPDKTLPAVILPEDMLIVGWPSGVKHSVGGHSYGVARTAAFMGKAILEKSLGKSLSFLAELAPSALRESATRLPENLTGADFRIFYKGVSDPLSKIDERESYPVRAATFFPIEESHRSRIAVEILSGRRVSEEGRALLGELMFQSHLGYTAMGLGCEETDAMVQSIREKGPAAGLYGARISGGGSGGTVTVLMHRTALPLLEKLHSENPYAPARILPLIH